MRPTPQEAVLIPVIRGMLASQGQEFTQGFLARYQKQMARRMRREDRLTKQLNPLRRMKTFWLLFRRRFR